MKNIILIDYENLQVKNLDELFEIDSEICVFTGPLQKKYSADWFKVRKSLETV